MGMNMHLGEIGKELASKNAKTVIFGPIYHGERVSEHTTGSDASGILYAREKCMAQCNLSYGVLGKAL